MSVKVDRGRLIALRLERRLATSELANKAGLAYRTVLDLERGRRRKVEEITLLRLADALGCPPRALMDSPPDQAGASGGHETEAVAPAAPAPRRRRFLVAALPLLLIGVLLSGWALLRGESNTLPSVAIEGKALVARHCPSGEEVWRFEAAAPVYWCIPGVWSDEEVLFALGCEGSDGGRVLLARRRDGRILWEFAPDGAGARLAFPEPMAEIPHAGVSGYRLLLDLDGDGERELAANFHHVKYFPFWVSMLDRRGRHLGTYLSRGSLYDPIAVDLDGDGAQEYLTGGTNNSKAMQGATIILLDQECHTGVALDTVSGDTACLPDSARVRVVLPSFGEPWMSLLNTGRLESRNLRVVRDEAGDPTIIADLYDESICTITLDRALRPLSAEPTRLLLDLAALWPAPYTNGGPADREWLGAWLRRAHRFEAGHYPPEPCEPSPAPASAAALSSR